METKLLTKKTVIRPKSRKNISRNKGLFVKGDEDSYDPNSIQKIPISKIKPSEFNKFIYHFDNDKGFIESIRKYGQQVPIVITLDHVIVSGHRRYYAMNYLGIKTVKIVYKNYMSDNPQFKKDLIEFNEQRIKSVDELYKEKACRTDPSKLKKYRNYWQDKICDGDVDYNFDMDQLEKRKDSCNYEDNKRTEITYVKLPLLEAVKKVIIDNYKYRPLTIRRIYYALLKQRPIPLIHASKPNSKFSNNEKSYRALVDIVTRARISGDISWDEIADPTRPVVVSKTFKNVKPFIDKQYESFLRGYSRNYLQSQTAFYCIILENKRMKQ